MTSKRALSLPLLSIALFTAAAQSQAPAQDHTITLDVYVRDGADNIMTGLKQKDFYVTDNGVSQTLTSFAEVTGESAPPTIVLVYDLINNSPTYSSLLRDQLTHILQQNNGQLKYPMFLTVVTSTGVSSSPAPTTNGNALAKLLASVPIGPDVNQHLTGAEGAQHRLNASIKALNDTLGISGKIPGRKLIFWMSQGWALMGGQPLTPGQEQDIFSAVKQYSTGMRQTHITLYKLDTAGATASPAALGAYRQYLKGVNTPNKTDFADMSLEVLATQSGGLVLNSNDLPTMFNRCLKDAEQHYEIEFPAGAPAKNVAFHDVQIKITQPNETARTRNGYYGQ